VGGDAELYQALRADRALDLQLGREGPHRRAQQRFGGGEFTDRGHDAVDALVHPDGELVDTGLGLDDGPPVGNRAPPALSGRVADLLHHALAVAATGRADVHPAPVVLRDRGERCGHLPAGGKTDCRHPVELPSPSGPAELAHHLVQGLDQVREVLRLRQHRPPPARVRERPNQKMGMLTHSPPLWGIRQFQPVELDLLTRRVRDHRDVTAGGSVAGLVVRPSLITAMRPRERRVRTLVAERSHLAEQRRSPQVEIVRELLPAIRQERHERIRRLASLTGDPLTVQIGADRLAISAQVPCDRRDRPSLATQSVSVHVFLPREHSGPRPGRTRSSRRLSTTHPAPFDTPGNITRKDRTRSPEGWGAQQSRFAPRLSSKRGDSNSPISPPESLDGLALDEAAARVRDSGPGFESDLAARDEVSDGIPG
jgi:hypothetical protein